MPVRFLKFICF